MVWVFRLRLGFPDKYYIRNWSQMLFTTTFYWHQWPLLPIYFNLNPTWISIYLYYKVWVEIKGCVSLDPSKISKSGWWGLQLDAWQLCNSLWYGLINSKLHINKKKKFLYHTTSDGVTVQCFKSPSWPLRDGLDLWPQLIYTLSWESQLEEI